MCVSCREPLAVAQSPQALAERNYIRHLIALGMTKPQIEQALVGQYGEAVLGKPPADGFNLTVYILPAGDPRARDRDARVPASEVAPALAGRRGRPSRDIGTARSTRPTRTGSTKS